MNEIDKIKIGNPIKGIAATSMNAMISDHLCPLCKTTCKVELDDVLDYVYCMNADCLYSHGSLNGILKAVKEHIKLSLAVSFYEKYFPVDFENNNPDTHPQIECKYIVEMDSGSMEIQHWFNDGKGFGVSIDHDKVVRYCKIPMEEK